MKTETLDLLPGEGEEKTVTSARVRAECVECGDPAHFKHSYLLPHARSNQASSAYGRDDCAWCSDHDEFTCRTCKRPEIDGYSWCSTFSATAQFAHMFLEWREQKAGNDELTRTRKDALTMALRLMGESRDTFAPETAEVMDRWEPIAMAAIRTELTSEAAAT